MCDTCNCAWNSAAFAVCMYMYVVLYRSAEGDSLHQVEMEALLMSLQNCNQPRLISEDVQIIKLLLCDLFNCQQDSQNQYIKVLEVT